jgi:hypothetical protein
MHRPPIISIALLLCFWPAFTGHSVATSAETPAEKLKQIEKEFNAQGYALRQSKTDEEREETVAQVSKLTARLLELAKQNPKQPIAMDALVQVVIHEMWMENNTPHLERNLRAPPAKPSKH